MTTRRKAATNGNLAPVETPPSNRAARRRAKPVAPAPQRTLVGQLTIAEGDEIKARQEMVKRLRQQATDLAFAAAAVEESVGHYLRAALRARGLSGDVQAEVNGDLYATVP